MTDSKTSAAFLRGARAGAPFLLVVGPFGFLFGVVGTAAGLDLLQVLAFSVLVIAGAAQFTALQLMVDHTPTLIVIAAALAVNLRMAMYSAALAPHLGALPFWQRALAAYLLVDQTFLVSSQEFERHPDMPLAAKAAFYFGAMAPIFPVWVAGTVAGAMLGQDIPDGLAIDFAVPLTFIAMIAPALRTPAHVVAAVVSAVAALILAPLPPWNLGLLVAGVLAMAAGAEVERRLASAAQPRAKP